MMDAPTGCPVTDLDPWSDASLADPYPVYKPLRDIGPVVWFERYKVAALPRFADVRQALTDWQTFTSAKGACIDHQQAVAMSESILTTDPPMHGGYRKPLTDLLSVASLADEVRVIEAVADEFAERLVRGRTFDGVKDLSAPYSVKVVMDLLGFPNEGRDRIAPLGERAFNTMGPADARHADGVIALQELAELTHGNVDQLCPGRHGERLVQGGHGMLAYTWPGIDTTVHALSSAVLEFARNPDQWDLVRADPGLIPSAFNEVLRLHTPVQTFARVTAKPVTIGDVELPADVRVAVMFASANRDERRYVDPDRFDVTRNPLDHLAFGRGIHLCVGMHLARIEAHSLFAALARRVVRFELAAEPVWKPNNTLHGLGSLPVRVVPASRA
jgi:cytochrome P450